MSPCSPVVLALHKAGGFTHVVADASAFSKGLLPRVAALLDVAQISDVLEVRDDSTFMRPVCAGNALTVSSSRRTLSRCGPTVFDKAPTSGGTAEISAVSPEAATGAST